MSNIKELDLFFLEEFINKQVCLNKDKNDIVTKLGNIDRVNNSNTYFLTPYNKSLKKIIVYLEKDEIKSITILAEFDFYFTDIVKKYGSYREYYSPHDDIYFYFFNEKNEIPYFIECENDTKYNAVNMNKKDLIKKVKIIFKS
ncbi:hypothetical protein [Flavobacterium sp.]|uniref:hypothetical protein n=1 Tax=Flavobacterium sp. TaxID=239 RepID=UPI0039187FE7